LSITGQVEEAGAEAVPEDFIIVIEFNLVERILMLVYFLFQLDDGLVQFLPLLEQL
jgi:hypothetical protein